MLALMAGVAVLVRKGGCAVMLLVGGGFFVTVVGPARTLPMAFLLGGVLLVLTWFVARSQERRSPRRDWGQALLGLLWCTLALPFVLSWLGVPLDYTKSTQACRSHLMNIGTALEIYSTDFSGRYPRNLDQLAPNYLKTIPLCRRTSGEDIPELLMPLFQAQGVRFEEYGYEPNPEGEADSYRVWCRSGHGGLDPDYPQYTSEAGLIEYKPTEEMTP